MANLNSDDIDRVARAMQDMTAAQNAATAELEAARDKVKKFKAEIGAAGKSYADALTSGERGFAKYNSSITSLSSAVGDAVGNFGILGKVAGGLIKVFSALATSGLKQNDALFKAYQNLSDFGDIGAGGIKGTLDKLNSFGLAADQAATLERVLKSIAPELAGLGGTVGSGVAMFGKVIKTITGENGSGSPLETTLMRLGYTQEQYTENASKFLARETILGRTRGKTEAELARASGAFLEQLTGLTAITGLSREQQQAVYDDQMRDMRQQQFYEHLKATGRQAEAKSIEDMIILAASMKMSPTDIAGLKDISRGAIGSNEAIKLMYSSAGKVNDIMRRVGNTTTGSVAGLKELSLAQRSVADKFRSATSQTTEFQQAMGISEESYLAFAKIQGMSEEEAKKQLEQMKKETENRLNNNIKSVQNDRAIKLLMEQAQYRATEGLIDVLTKLQTAMTRFGKVIAKVVDKFSWMFGYSGPPLSDMFRDLDDVNQDLVDTKKDEVSVTEKLVIAQKELSQIQNRSSAEYINREKEQRTLAHTLRLKAMRMEPGEAKDAAWKEALAEKLKLDQMQSTSSKNKNQLLGEVTSLTTELKSLNEKMKKLETEQITRGGVKSPVDPTTGNSLINWGSGTGSASHFSSLPESTQSKFNAMIAEYGKSVTVTSARRSPEEQADLYRRWKEAGGSEKNPSAGGITMPVPPGGRDNHVDGRALDIDKESYSALVKAGLLEKYGFGTVKGDEGHIQLPQGRSGGLFRGPPTGYNVRLHGNEIVVPMPSTGGISGNINKTDLSKYTSGTSNSDLSDRMGMLMSDVSDMVNYLRRSVDAQEKLLQVARN